MHVYGVALVKLLISMPMLQKIGTYRTCDRQKIILNSSQNCNDKNFMLCTELVEPLGLKTPNVKS